MSWASILQIAQNILPGHALWLLIAIAARLAYVGYTSLVLHNIQKIDQQKRIEQYPRFKKRAKIIMAIDAIALFLFCLEYANEIQTNVAFTVGAGFLLCLIGIGVKVSAARVLGEDGYYWKDFLSPRIKASL